MKLWGLQQYSARRSNSFRAASPLDGAVDGIAGGGSTALLKSPGALFWLALHALCCLVSLILGFRFSRLVFFLLLSSPAPSSFHSVPLLHASFGAVSSTTPPPPPANHTVAAAASRVTVGRHGIRIRPWPHPNPSEVMKAHALIERVQQEQRSQYGVKSPRPVIAITPTYARTFQALHLTGLIHSLMLLPYAITWIVVEAGGKTSDTADLIASSKLSKVIHLPFPEKMPIQWADRHRVESRMRLHALREIREQRLDGIVVFADDSNMHSMELFDEIQKVNWFGALSIGILAHSGNSDPAVVQQQQLVQRADISKENMPVPVQGPACNASSKLAGWHTFNTLPYSGSSANFVGDIGTVLPTKLEWAGFVVNSRLLWKEVEDRPDWVGDIDSLLASEDGIETPLALLKDASYVEPLGNCGKKIMLWWLRVEARYDSKYPSGWLIDPPLEVVVPAKRTPWPDVPPELPFGKAAVVQSIQTDKRTKPRSSRSRRGSRGKRRHDSRSDEQISGVSNNRVQEK